MPFFSIIIPVFNAEAFIAHTVANILRQQFNDYELLLIDDGSTDGTGEICDDLASTNSNVIVFHTFNEGISNARNRGLHAATGKYVVFMDHDDEVNDNLLQIVYNKLSEKDVDILKFGYKEILSENGNIISERSLNITGDLKVGPSDISKYFLKIFDDKLLINVWDGVFSRSFLIRHQILFNTRFIYGGEDIDFNLQCIGHKPVIYFISDVLYYHYIRIKTSTSTKFNISRLTNLQDWSIRFNDILKKLGVVINRNTSILYTDIILKEQIGPVVDILTSKECNYSESEKIRIIKKIVCPLYVDSNFFRINPFRLLKKDLKYGILYVLIKLRWYSMCIKLYNMRVKLQQFKTGK